MARRRQWSARAIGCLALPPPGIAHAFSVAGGLGSNSSQQERQVIARNAQRIGVFIAFQNQLDAQKFCGL